MAGPSSAGSRKLFFFFFFLYYSYPVGTMGWWLQVSNVAWTSPEIGPIFLDSSFVFLLFTFGREEEREKSEGEQFVSGISKVVYAESKHWS